MMKHECFVGRVLLMVFWCALPAMGAGLTVYFGEPQPQQINEVVFEDIPSAHVPLVAGSGEWQAAFDSRHWQHAERIDRFQRICSDAKRIAAGISAEGSWEEFYEEALVPSKPMSAWLMCDESHLYVNVRCWDDDTRKLVVEPSGKRDGAVWNADSVELFIAPSQDGAEYFHFIVDSRGTLYDSRNRIDIEAGRRNRSTDASWNADVHVLTRLEAQRWDVLMKIPLADMGLEVGRGIRMNLCRSRRVGSFVEHTTWAAVEDSFHEIERFGEVSLGETSSRQFRIQKIVHEPVLWGENLLKVVAVGQSQRPDQVMVNTEITNSTG